MRDTTGEPASAATEVRMKVLLVPTVLTTVALSLLTFARSADAQPLGTFRWQLQPFCTY
jgi:hypothetical protein